MSIHNKRGDYSSESVSGLQHAGTEYTRTQNARTRTQLIQLRTAYIFIYTGFYQRTSVTPFVQHESGFGSKGESSLR